MKRRLCAQRRLLFLHQVFSLLSVVSSFNTCLVHKTFVKKCSNIRPTSCRGHIATTSPRGTALRQAIVPESRSNGGNQQQKDYQRESSSPTSSSSSSESTTKSLFRALDQFGLSLKPRAVKAGAKVARSDKKFTKFVYLLQSCMFYSLFILYRGYRGFFVILPAVFREVYRKLETAVDDRPFLDDDDDKNDGGGSIVADDDINPATGKVRWRTRVTVSVLASIVTVSYVLGGAIRVLSRLFTSLIQTSNVSGSFAAAAMEQEANESKILRIAQGTNNSNNNNDETNATESINGRDGPPNNPKP